MWRKNRRPIGNFFGVDLNRNWNSNWLGKFIELPTYIGRLQDFNIDHSKMICHRDLWFLEWPSKRSQKPSDTKQLLRSFQHTCQC